MRDLKTELLHRSTILELRTLAYSTLVQAAVALKKHLPVAAVSAIDISENALKTAESNSKLHNVAVNFIQADVLSVVSEHYPVYDIIVSNPPYVTLEDKALMHDNVNDFEPHTALFVPQHDPLIFYKSIASFADTNLQSGGLIFLEINEAYGEETVKLLADKQFINIALRKDMSGRDRMIRAVKV
jgi:release factor glutamine methyltransferase